MVSKNDQTLYRDTEQQQGATPPLSTTNGSIETSENRRILGRPGDALSPQVLAGMSNTGDTVDGMGVITFADEAASGYFGL